jgi:GNAT superfamily N-acetyltransferase
MLKFKEISVIDDSAFKKTIQIYIDSFPENQRLPIDVLTQRTEENTHQILGGFLNNQVVLMSILHLLKDTDFIVLTYLATEKNFRAQGIGKQFFNYILNWVNKEHKYLILEVEDPDFGEEEDRDKKIKRIEFYRKMGAVEMQNVNYMLPPLSGNIPTEMKLLLIPKYPHNFLDGDLVKKLIKQIYKEVYSRNEDDIFLNLN